MERWSKLLHVVKCGVCLSEMGIHISEFSEKIGFYKLNTYPWKI